MSLRIDVDIGPPILSGGRVVQVDQEGEELGPDVRVRSEPESLTILGLLHPQMASLDLGPAEVRKHPDHLAVPEEIRHVTTDRMVEEILATEINTQLVVLRARPLRVDGLRRFQGKLIQSRHHLRGKKLAQIPMPIRALMLFAGFQARKELCFRGRN